MPHKRDMAIVRVVNHSTYDVEAAPDGKRGVNLGKILHEQFPERWVDVRWRGEIIARWEPGVKAEDDPAVREERLRRAGAEVLAAFDLVNTGSIDGVEARLAAALDALGVEPQMSFL
jgi:hypothetical protein